MLKLVVHNVSLRLLKVNVLCTEGRPSLPSCSHIQNGPGKRPVSHPVKTEHFLRNKYTPCTSYFFSFQQTIARKFPCRNSVHMLDYSITGLRAGQPKNRVSCPDRGKRCLYSAKCSERLWGPPSHLFNGGRRMISRAGRG